MTHPNDRNTRGEQDATPTQQFPPQDQTEYMSTSTTGSTQAYSAVQPEQQPATLPYSEEYSFPEEQEAREQDYDSIPVPRNSDTGRLITTYIDWAHAQGFDAQDLNTVEHFLSYPSLYQDIPAGNPRYILQKWVAGDIVLVDDTKDKKPYIIAGIVAVLAILAIALFFILGGKKGDDKNETDPFSTPTTSAVEKPPAPRTPATQVPPKAPATVTVPNLEGKTLSVAKESLAKQQIGVDTVYTEDDDIYTGDPRKAIVVKTTPGAGEKIGRSDASVSIVVKVLKTPTKEKPAPTVTKTKQVPAPAPTTQTTPEQQKPTTTTTKQPAGGNQDSSEGDSQVSEN